MSSHNDPQDLGHAAARITLLALGASLGEGTSHAPRRYLIGGASGPLAAEAAVALLAHMTKPVLCTATVDVPGVLRVKCAPPLTAGERFVHKHQVSAVEQRTGVLAFGGAALPEPRDSIPVLVRAGGDHIIVPMAALEQWIRDYVVAPGHLWIGSGEADDHERLLGASYVLSLGRADPLAVPP